MSLSISLQKKLFQTLKYRKFIEDVIASQAVQRGYRKQLAECAGCQPAYFSQVMAEKVELTPEQAERLCQFWGLSVLEGEYFFELVSFSRAGTSSLRKRLHRRLDDIKNQWLNSVETFDKPSIDDSKQASLYYSHWLHSAIHLLLTVPGFDQAQQIANHLQQPLERVVGVLGDLESTGLVIKTQRGWKTTNAQIHATNKDFFAEIHHKNWRLQAAEVKCARRKSIIRYTSVHTLSEQDLLKVKDLLEQFIKDTRGVIAPSPEETAACLVLDYFTI
jgi:uncharacterized protein (TIGR02147 family)